MDILFVIEDANLRGGTEILTFNLEHSLNARGANVKILSLVPYQGDEDGVISLSNSEYKRWSICRKSILDKLCFCLFSDFVLRKILCTKMRELRPQLLVNQTYDIITALPPRKNVAQVFNWSIKGYETLLKNPTAMEDLKEICIKIAQCFFIEEIAEKWIELKNKVTNN